MRKPVAVERRDVISKTGPSLMGRKRMDKLVSPRGEEFIFLGVTEGEVYLERVNKAPNAEPFVKIDSSELMKYKQVE